LAARAIHVSKEGKSRSRTLALVAGFVAVCAEASAFVSCSFNTQGSLPIVVPPVAPNLAITVSPGTITLGQSATLSWSSNSVTACVASGAWSGPQPPQGTSKVTPTTAGTFAYVLGCSTPIGSLAETAVLTVKPVAAAASARSFIHARRGGSLLRTNLVADTAGTTALNTDPNLGDPWGIVLPEQLPAVVTSRASNTSTSYDGAGVSRPPSGPLPVQLPSGHAGAAFGAAGVVANSSDGFVVSAGVRSAPARLLYAGTSGTIAGWSPEVEVGNAIVAYAADDAARYTALAIAISSTPGESRLYAADFRNAKVDVFDSAFRKQARSATRFTFTDPSLPPGYAPFGIAVIDELVYIAYAQRPASGTDPVSGPGRGVVAVFTTSGEFISRLVTEGVLDAPWSIVRSPADGTAPFSRALLVGNTGDGRINAFDAVTGALLGSFTDATGAALVVPNLHGLAFGNHYAKQPRTTLFFSAGAHDGANGWYGRIDFPVPLQGETALR
jgi:uncharacterized protein (TIGR03118 family)